MTTVGIIPSYHGLPLRLRGLAALAFNHEALTPVPMYQPCLTPYSTRVGFCELVCVLYAIYVYIYAMYKNTYNTHKIGF